MDGNLNLETTIKMSKQLEGIKIHFDFMNLGSSTVDEARRKSLIISKVGLPPIFVHIVYFQQTTGTNARSQLGMLQSL